MTASTNIVYNVLFFFIIYSVAGWMLESAFRSIIEKKIINSGFMNGPYCPIYGFGALMMMVVLQNLKGDVTLLFIASFILLTSWEYLVGVILEKIYHTKYWDYSDHKINFKGRICLTNSVYWGILGVVFILIIHPFVTEMAKMISIGTLKYIDFSVLMIMLLDFIISSIKVNTVAVKVQELKNIGEKVLLKVKETNTIKLNKSKNMQNKEIENTRLQIQYNRMKIALYKQLTRLKKAFPTMQSDTINKFLNEKVDVKELKNRIKELKEHLKKK